MLQQLQQLPLIASSSAPSLTATRRNSRCSSCALRLPSRPSCTTRACTGCACGSAAFPCRSCLALRALKNRLRRRCLHGTSRPSLNVFLLHSAQVRCRRGSDGQRYCQASADCRRRCRSSSSSWFGRQERRRTHATLRCISSAMVCTHFANAVLAMFSAEPHRRSLPNPPAEAGTLQCALCGRLRGRMPGRVLLWLTCLFI